MTVKDWDDIEDILFDGTTKEIQNLLCPDCNTKINYKYTHDTNSLQYGCKICGRMVRLAGCHITPNCSNLNK